MGEKVIILGLDGGTWRVFDPLLKDGYMPNLKKLMDAGISGVLESTKPPITPAAWTSFQTGTNPGKHGVFNFVNFNKKNIQFNMVNSSSIKVETFLEYLSKNGKSVISINLPVTYPPKKVNGIIISGFLTPSLKSEFTYPKELKKQILKKFPNYTISPLDIFFKYYPIGVNFQKFLNGMVNQVEEKRQLALYLMKKYKWDVIFIQFQSLDNLQHAVWPYLDKEHKLFDRARSNAIASRYFTALDKAIGELIEAAKTSYGDDNILSIAISDHGFQGVKAKFNLRRWLYDNGYLVLDKTSKRGFKQNLISLLAKIDRHEIRRRIHFVRKYRAENKNVIDSNLKADTDFNNSLAVGLPINGWGNIFLLNGAEGSISQKMITELKELKDPVTRENIVKTIYTKNEIYHGATKNCLPDILVEPSDGYVFTSHHRYTTSPLYLPVDKKNERFFGDHDIKGIFIFSGNMIRPCIDRPYFHIQDIVPTIYYFLGLPIPQIIDGKVRKEIFIDKISKNLSIQYCDSSIGNKINNQEQLQKSEELAIEERLKGLGYL